MAGTGQRLSSELAYLRGAMRMLRATQPMAKDRASTVNGLFAGLVARHGDRLALTDGINSLTYRQMGERAARYAQLAVSLGLGKGDVVALLMPNCPDFACVWQGLAQRGVVTALINTNLVGGALLQCILAARPRAIIVAEALRAPFAAVRGDLPAETTVLGPGDMPEALDLGALLAAQPATPLPDADRPALVARDPCLYVYTSGTTGLPKAANLNHYRVQLSMLAFAAAVDARADDRVYDCLPMYHTVGGVCALGAALVNGGTLVIRPRFSARDFWDEIRTERCTLFPYIGELCRYLLNQPATALDRSHKVRLCFGNGLRPDIFDAFRERFGLRRIIEFYAATESNVSLFNFDTRSGSVGRIPSWLRRKFPYAIVRFDLETGAVERGADGFCLRCEPDEAGEILGEILDDPSRPGMRFEGYADAASTARKVLRDVFRHGDAWFSTGDIMRMDRRGYYFFLDRTGDTFRWKGENVSTTQVAEVICGFPPVREAAVYGVAVPGCEGRAGMAAIVCERLASFDLDAFRRHVARQLPDYARPLFLRFTEALATTATFKPKKGALAAAGFHPTGEGTVFVFDAAAARYRLLDEAEHVRLLSGGYRL